MRTGILILAFVYGTALFAAQMPLVYRITSDFEGVNAAQERYRDLYELTQVLEDPTGQRTYEDILGRENAFGPNTTRSQKELRKVFWVKLQLQALKRDSFLFSVGKLYDDHNLVDIYYERGDSLIHQRSGFRRKPAQKAVRRSGSYFWVELPADTVQTVYIRVDNTYGDCSYCWRQPTKFPVSIYHIDPTTISHQEAVYVLQGFPESPTSETSEAPRMVDLKPYFEFYADAKCSWDLDSVIQDWDNGAYFTRFKLVDFPYDTCHWVRLRVINPDTMTRTQTLAYLDTRWEKITYYLPNAAGQYTRYEAFPDANAQKAFSFSVPPRDSLWLYIRYGIRNRDYTFAIHGGMIDIHPDDLLQGQQKSKYKYLMLGALFFFLIYFFLQLLIFRDLLLRYYFIGVLGVILLALVWLDNPQLFRFTSMFFSISKTVADPLSILAPALAVFGLLKFTQTVLDLKKELPGYYQFANGLILLYTLLSLIHSLDFFRFWMTGRPSDDICFGCYANSIRVWINPMVAGFIMVAGIRAYRKKIPLSGYFMVALLPIILPILFNFLSRLSFNYNFADFNFFLLGLFGTLLLFGLLIGARFKRVQSEKLQAAKQKAQLQNQLLQIEFKALRAQMNPHFIFNCLNSIKSLIQESANKQAIHYLTLFSRFIRKILHHSEEKLIPLEEELEMSRLYLEMEKLRFEKSFNYQITVAPEVDVSFVKVPPMILQPFLENAIWHGLMHKNGERLLHLEILQESETVKCVVDDNGIGREKAAVLQAGMRNQHRSFGTKLTLDRLKVNKELFDNQFVINIIDKMVNGTATGTRVELSLSA